MRDQLIAAFLISLCFLINTHAQDADQTPSEAILSIPDLLVFWDFQTSENEYLTSKGKYQYRLEEMNGPIEIEPDGIFGPTSLKIIRTQWLRIKRKDCPGLNLHGRTSVTMIAWIKRRVDVHWQYIAGMWDERNAARQYALFTSGHKQTDYTTLTRTDADHQPHGYVSDVGGATPDRPFCFSYATGATKMEYDQWRMIAFTYDQKAIRVYVDGKLDENGNYNPFYWDKPIYDAGDKGGDFTVAQRDVRTWPDYPEGAPGNKVGFGGVLGGVAVFDRALTPEEIQNVYRQTMLKAR